MVSVKHVLLAIENFLQKSKKLGLIKEFSMVLTHNTYEENSDTKELLSEFMKKLNEEFMKIEAKLPQSESQKVFEHTEIESSMKNVLDQIEKDTNEMEIEIKVPQSEAQEVFEHTESKLPQSEIEAKLPQSEAQEVIEHTETGSSIKNDLVLIQINTNEMEIEAKLAESEAKELFKHTETKLQQSEFKTNFPQTEAQEVFEQTETESSMKNDLVQIQIDTSEMKRRIEAFSARKRQEVDEWNVQEFCGRSYIDEQDPAWEEQDSCARVDAVFIPRRGCKSHIKVSKVENNYGPQTMVKKIKTEFIEENESATSQVIDERIKHMEQHLKLETDSSLRSSIFERLKNLEERILYLEGLSPEYIHIANSEYTSPKKKNFSEKEKLYSNWSIPDLNKRIKTLKEMLRKK